MLFGFTRLLASIAIGGLMFVPLAAFAFTSPGEPNGYVNDFAHVLTTDQITALSQQVHELKETTGDQLAIVTVSSTGDETIEQYASTLFHQWGIGEKDKDNGVLLLLAIADHHGRIEVGYGLEPVLTDARSAQIIAGAVPLLRDQKIGEAVSQMATQIGDVLRIGAAIDGVDRPVSTSFLDSNWFWAIVGIAPFAITFIFIVLVIFFVKRKGGSGFGGGSGGGGFSSSSDSSSSWSSDSSSSSSDSSSSSSDSFGGGDSGGGGASGSW